MHTFYTRIQWDFCPPESDYSTSLWDTKSVSIAKGFILFNLYRLKLFRNWFLPFVTCVHLFNLSGTCCKAKLLSLYLNVCRSLPVQNGGVGFHRPDDRHWIVLEPTSLYPLLQTNLSVEPTELASPIIIPLFGRATVGQTTVNEKPQKYWVDCLSLPLVIVLSNEHLSHEVVRKINKNFCRPIKQIFH